MKPAELLADIHARGVALSCVDGRLRIDAPKGIITDELRATLFENKPALLAILTAKPLCSGCHEHPIADGSGFFCADCLAKMHATDDPTTHECPSCGGTARRLGWFIAANGEGRYHCGLENCSMLWRQIPSHGAGGF